MASCEPRARPSRVFFSIPLASRTDAESWSLANALLGQTLRSIINQTSPDFDVVICCHDRPYAPEMDDERIRYIQADFPRAAGPSEFIRDKAWKRRLTYQEIARLGGGYVVLQDGDDILSNRLVDYMRNVADPNGYIYRMGYAMNHQTGEIAPVPGVWRKPFNHVCGSCATIWASPEDIGPKGGREAYLGEFKQHALWEDVAAQADRTLHRVPFPTCIYVLNSHHNMSSKLNRSDQRVADLMSAIETHKIAVSPQFAREFALDERR